PADLDALAAAGDVVWVGAGAIGSGDGRVWLLFRDQAALLVTDDALEPPSEPIHDALRARLAERGASFWPDLVAAAHEAGLPYDDETVLGALWDLLWAGEVTNDTLAPLRALVAPKASRGRRTPPVSRRTRGPALGRPRLGALSASGPPSAV